ncbi:MAG TPA: TadE/TadG family type IV pilus assembly protein [Pyrinomonadaceae bacterium]
MKKLVGKSGLLRRLRLSLRPVRFARDERGVQLVELAIVLPLFMLLFAATAEFGRFFYDYTTLAKGARNGVRYLVIARADGSQDLAAKRLIVYGNTGGTGSPLVSGLTTDNVRITRRDASGAAITAGVPQTVTVQIVSFKFAPLFDLGAFTNNPAYSLRVDIKPSVTMRYLLTTPLV